MEGLGSLGQFSIVLCSIVQYRVVCYYSTLDHCIAHFGKWIVCSSILSCKIAFYSIFWYTTV